MSVYQNCPCLDVCALQEALNLIGGKWKPRVLCSLLRNGDSRYNELLRNVKGLSNTMLSQTLKELERDGMVKRTEYLEVPIRVEYSLTEKARRMEPVLEHLILWYLKEHGFQNVIDERIRKKEVCQWGKQESL